MRLAIISAAILLSNLAGPGVAQAKKEVIKVEISENALTFAFQGEPVFKDKMPSHGNPFITTGYIYPAGTIKGDAGVNADGTAQYPDKVIGEWICRGWTIFEGAHAKTGLWVMTTQTFRFYDKQNKNSRYAGKTLTTDGHELVDNKEVCRAVTGGTGPYMNARGQQIQVNNGLNKAQGVNLSMTFELIL